MDCCGNIFRKARTSLAMIGETFRLLPMHSITGPAKHSRGEHRRKCLPTNYTQVHDTVLRRQVESAQYTSVRFGETLSLSGIRPRSAVSAMLTTMRWPRPRSDSTRTTASAPIPRSAEARSPPSAMSNTSPPTTSPGTTSSASCTASEESHPPKPKPSTIPNT